MNVHLSTIAWPHRCSHEEILSRWGSEPESALITETHGALTTQWLFLNSIGDILIGEHTTAAPSLERATIEQFFAFVDELGASIVAPIPALAGYLGYEALMRHHGVTTRRRPDGILGRYSLYSRIIEITSHGVREHTLSYDNLPSWVLPRCSSSTQSLPQPNYPSSITLDTVRTSLALPDPTTGLTHLFADQPTLSAAHHQTQVTTTQEMIRSGEVYQLNLSMHLSVLASLDPIALGCWLTGAGRSSQMALLRWPDRLIASASPELFLRRDGATLTCRPIKGTRPRGRDPIEDRRNATELAQSPKDRAELSMIVDLVRNDLHRVCLPGSVQVVAHATIEQHAFVHHTVSTITGTISPDTTSFALWDSLFPSGSISGAPKIAALRAIASLESHYRDVYCGAIGCFGGSYFAHHSVAIRTISAEHGVVSLWAGGGITIESDPAREYEECLWKLLTALQLLSTGTAA